MTGMRQQSGTAMKHVQKVRSPTQFCYHSVARQCVHCCKGDAVSQWEMAILRVLELRNP